MDRAGSAEVSMLRILLALALSAAGCSPSAGPAAPAAPPSRGGVALEPCRLPNFDGEARCGVHEVFEDRRAGSGRTIRIFVAVLPAHGTKVAPDPIFVLAGGPGQAASILAGFANESLAGLRDHRDIVLVDLAGTGRSGALRCPMYPTASEVVGDFYPLARVRACRETLGRRTDLRRYTTPNLMDDLDDVRAALGYQTINIYGTSYGTRAALIYLRRHPAHVRAIVLKALVPPTMRGTMQFALGTERSLGRIFRACAEDAACSRAFPRAEAELREVLSRAERGELRGLVPGPSGEAPVELPLGRGVVASTLLGLLQNSNSAVRLPLLIHTTFEGDTRALLDGIVSYRRALDEQISFGMHLSVVCSEDAPRMDPAAAAIESRGTALGDYRVAQLASACREWVRGEVPADYAEPVRSDVPALLVSGTLDPNTNETWGEETARTLTRARHVVIPNLSHAFSSIAECGANFIAEFIEAGSADRIDVSCASRVALPPFALSAR
jgi:pimeloyl-ACP methyl ester carboxylesterase